MVYDETGQQITGFGIWLGHEAVTNNQAEVKALEAAVEYLVHNRELLSGKKGAVITGDSRLIIDFM